MRSWSTRVREGASGVPGVGSRGRFPYILIGMAVIAMCFNLMQQKVVQGVRSMGRKIGIIKD